MATDKAPNPSIASAHDPNRQIRPATMRAMTMLPLIAQEKSSL